MTRQNMAPWVAMEDSWQESFQHQKGNLTKEGNLDQRASHTSCEVSTHTLSLFPNLRSSNDKKALQPLKTLSTRTVTPRTLEPPQQAQNSTAMQPASQGDLRQEISLR